MFQYIIETRDANEVCAQESLLIMVRSNLMKTALYIIRTERPIHIIKV